ncbi:hypothetical protein RB595_001930 [Gaeumannomyces hyphopodioides]
MRQTFTTFSILLALGGVSAGVSAGVISQDATCGQVSGNTCQDSAFGNCCSKYGWCGSSAAHCGSGCQSGFGTCNGPATPGGSQVSDDGTCGNGVTCMGSEFGNCCSSSGWCGSTQDYCGEGCQTSFGQCGGASGSSSAAASAPTPTSSGSASGSSSTATSAPSAAATGAATGAARTYALRSRDTKAPACDYTSFTTYYESTKLAPGADGMFAEGVADCQAKCDALAGCKVFFFTKSNPAWRKMDRGDCLLDTNPWQNASLSCILGTLAFSAGYELV